MRDKLRVDHESTKLHPLCLSLAFHVFNTTASYAALAMRWYG